MDALQEISNNYVWLKPICEAFPTRIPSGFFLMDVILRLDSIMKGRLLLKPGQKETTKQDKVAMAKEEMERLKRLLSALRYLYRNGSLNVSCAPLFTLLLVLFSFFGGDMETKYFKPRRYRSWKL